MVIDATGSPAAGIRHVLACCAAGKHIVMVNVEADALAGPILARLARQAGIVYSLAYGDQPALICEQVDWARAAGFEVIAAGKGTKYLPAYHASTPETVWGHYGFSPETVAKGDFNAQMFNSFLDGTKSAIEMAAVANATGLRAAPGGLEFPPVRRGRPRARAAPEGRRRPPAPSRPGGGDLERRARRPARVPRPALGRVRDLRRRARVRAPLLPGIRHRHRPLGRVRLDVQAQPPHRAGAGHQRGERGPAREATGAATGFRGDCVATAKRDLKAGEMLDGEGGYTVYGKLMPASDSLKAGGLPIGLAHKVKLVKDVAAGRPVAWSDVAIDETAEAVKIRREMEREGADA